MARLKNQTTGIVINVADEKAARYENDPTWELEDAGAPAKPKEPTVAELKAEIDRRNEGREEDGAPAKPKEPSVDELKAEIDRRNEGREEDAKLSKDGKKADLVATLAADDAAQAQG